MSITVSENKKIFTLQTRHTTYQMKIDDLGYLLHLYYGGRVEQSMDYLLTYADRGFSGNPEEKRTDRTYSFDALPQEYPFMGSGDYRDVAFIMENPDGTRQCDLRVASYNIESGKYALAGLPAARDEEGEADTLSIVLVDELSGVQVTLLYGVYETSDVITRSVLIRNNGSDEIKIYRAASGCLDMMTGEYELIHFHGRHTMERQFERTAIDHGSFRIGSRRGMTSHQHNPSVILASKGANEEAGDVYGCMLSYSGGFFCETSKDQYQQTRLVMGMTDENFCYKLGAGDELVAPEAIFTYTDEGFSGLTHTMHDFIRRNIIRDPLKGMPHPVLINSWEAAYFNFSAETILHLAREAKSLGMDMVVMDDGWFGNRFDDNRSLGDWGVNEKKLGCTLGHLIKDIVDLGIKFGIWIEPEMVNEDSDLYREHPDWAMRIPGRKAVFARNQLVLDFSRAEVRDYIFDSITKVLDEGPVAYVKWDYNRCISDIYSAVNLPGEVLYKYIVGLYEFTDRLLKRYPNMILEGCSGGGGRFDTGMLNYAPQIWCSDNTDAIERLKIQHGTSFFYPISCVGSHVSTCPNHQTGRTTPFSTRAVVAMAGTFGYELDPAKLEGEERDEIKKQIAFYKKYQKLIYEGDYYRLSDPYNDGYSAWAFVSKDKKTYILNAVMTENHSNMDVKYIRLRGIDETLTYEASVSTESTVTTGDGMRYSGMALKKAGIPVMPSMMDFASVQIVYKAVED